MTGNVSLKIIVRVPIRVKIAVKLAVLASRMGFYVCPDRLAHWVCRNLSYETAT